MTKTFTYSLSKQLFLSVLATLLSIGFAFAQAPAVTSFSPSSGRVGSVVTISGSGFAAGANNNIVFFGATVATVTAATTTRLTVTVPSGATYQPISVLNTITALSGISARPFITTFAPSKDAITKDDFLPAVNFDTGGFCESIAIGDIDGDGKPDLVMANRNGGAISILRNTSTAGTINAASFAPKVDIIPVNGAWQIALADLDGDGKPDLVVTQGTMVSIYRNTATPGTITAGSFGTPVQLTSGGGGSYGLAIGDLDGDGKPDIVVANSENPAISIWRNISTPGSLTAGSFAGRVDYSSDNGLNGANWVAIGDLDGDGKLDIATANFNNNSISVFRNTTATGPFTADSFAVPVAFAAGNEPYAVAVADLDGDNKSDLVVTNANDNTISIFKNTAVAGSITAGSFAAPVNLAANKGTFFMAIGDLDGDGKPDIVAGPGAGNSVSIFRNMTVSGSMTAASFAPGVDFATAKNPISVAIGDLDGDGKPDIAATTYPGSFTGNSVSVLRNSPLFPPTNQASNIQFSNTVQNATRVSWTNGNGTSRAVFVSAGTAGSPLPANSTTYTANPVYTSGSQIGTSGWYCIYNGTGNTVDISGLSSGSTYRVMVVEYNGSAGAEDYLTTIASGNPANVTTLAGGAITINAINRVTSSPTNATTVQFTATFATAVSGLTANNFALVTSGGISGASISSVTGSGSAYTITVNTGTGDGTVSLNLANANGITPGIINPLPFISQAYTLDRTPPSITISAPSVNTLLSGAAQVTYTITYADANFNTSTLAASAITLKSNGSAAGVVSVSGSGTTYTVTIGGITGSGTLGFSIGQGTASDLAGNNAAAAGPSPTVEVLPVLSGLSTSQGVLAPTFASAVTSYTTFVANTVAALNVAATTTDPNATITVNGSSPSAPVSLVVGLNNITITVTTLDGSAKTSYTIGVVRAAPIITGQPPNIAYGNNAIVITSAAPFSITPANSGGAVPKTSYGQVSLFAGSPAETAGYVNDTGTAAQFNFPQAAVMDAAGNLFVADANNNAIRMIDPSGAVSTFAGSLTGESGFSDGVGTSARFSFPDGLTIDQAGNLYVADYSNNAIRKITSTGVVTTIYVATNAFGPGGLCLDAGSNIIVAAQDASQIIRITPAGAASVVAGSTPGYVNGAAASAQFNTPGDVKADAAGDLYIADFENNAIRKITPSGQVTTVAGSLSGIAGFADGIGNAALFNNPPGLYLGAGGIIYVADVYNNDIRQIMPDGTVSLVAGSAHQVAGDADGIGTAAGFNLPDYIYIDNTGTAYLSELGGNRIRKMTLTGYTLQGKLPAGLIFDPTTGIIRGRANVPFTATSDTITAYNAFGYSRAVITISYSAVSNVATLSNLQPNSGTLTPVFSSGAYNYTVSVPNSTASIAITPTATSPVATITINGQTVASGAASLSIPLNAGPNTITTIVTAQDGITKDTYTLTVNRAASTNALLSNLTISEGTLTPAFASGTANYTADELNSTTSISLVATVADPTATVSVNGSPAASGMASSPIPLQVGQNTVTTVVTAQDGVTENKYTLIVTRAPSTDALLSNLTISDGVLTPVFNSGLTAYADTVSGAVNGISVTATADDRNATIMVNDVPVLSGSASNFIPLTTGSNTISIVVTAQDGTTMKTYTTTIYKGEPAADMSANNVITPNGDGKNDFWVIKDIELYPQNSVTVFDKGGRLVYSKRGYHNEWDGTLNGSPLAEGTYYFVVDLGPNLRKFKGFISIIRN